MNNTTKSSEVKFQIDTGENILSAKLGKRFLARLLDFLFSALVGQILFIVFYSMQFNKISAESIREASATGVVNFYNFTMGWYNVEFIISFSLIIFFLIVFNILVPILNRKHPGQTFGKMIMKITPLFLKGQNVYWAIIRKELTMSIAYSLIFAFSLIAGYDALVLYSQYNSFYNKFPSDILGSPGSDGSQINNPYPKSSSVWHFMLNLITLPKVGVYNGIEFIMFGDNVASTYNIAFGFMKEISRMAFFLYLIVNGFWIGINPSRRAPSDMMAGIVIVDLKTIGRKYDEEPIQDYRPSEVGNTDFPIEVKGVEDSEKDSESND